MGKLPVCFIPTAMKVEGSSIKRPNTEDTLITWLNTDPKVSSALFVSDQPFCGYQFAIIKSYLPKEISFDVVGEGVDPKSHPKAAAITLDTIARWLYQESIYRSQEK